MPMASSREREEQHAEQRARPPLQLLDLPHELLERAVALLLPHEWGSFARASKTAKAVAQGAVGAVAAAEVSRRLVAKVHVGNRLCERCPALEITVPTSVTRIFPVRLCSCDPCSDVDHPHAAHTPAACPPSHEQHTTAPALAARRACAEGL